MEITGLPTPPEGYEDVAEHRCAESGDLYACPSDGGWTPWGRLKCKPSSCGHLICLRPKPLTGIDWLNKRVPGDVWKWRREIYVVHMGLGEDDVYLECITASTSYAWKNSDDVWSDLLCPFPESYDTLSDSTVEWLNHG